MRMCYRPYQYFYVGTDGFCKSCSWMDGKSVLGNLFDNTIEEIWNGEKCKYLQSTIEDDTFKHCRMDCCPMLNNNALKPITPEQFAKAKSATLRPYPRQINISFDSICNHACPTCRKGVWQPPEDHAEKMRILCDKLFPALQKCDQFSMCGRGDFLASPHLMKLAQKLYPENPKCKIILETNGALFKKKWHKIEHFSPYDVSLTITPNSFERETYIELTGGIDSYDATMQSIDFAVGLRKAGKIKTLKLTMVVQSRNYKQTSSFVEKALSLSVDQIQLRPVRNWFWIDKDTLKEKDLMNPEHPEHEQFIRIMKDPILDNPKILHWMGKF